MWTVALALGLLVYNNKLNRWPPFNGPLYVPLNLALTGAILLLAFGPAGLSAAELGLSVSLNATMLGLALGAGLALPFFALDVRDRRVAGIRGTRLAYRTLVRVPLGTAVTEEVAFRGVLYAAAIAEGIPAPALLASLTFGFWHVGPTLNLIDANRPEASPARRFVSVLVGVAGMTVAGLALVWVREETGGLVAPIAIHATVNSVATLAVVRTSSSRRALPRRLGHDRGTRP